MADTFGLIAELRTTVDDRSAERARERIQRQVTGEPIELDVEVDRQKLKEAQELTKSESRGYAFDRAKTRAKGAARTAGGLAKQGGKQAGQIYATRLLRKMGVPTTIPSNDLLGGFFGNSGGGVGNGSPGSAGGSSAMDPDEVVPILQAQLEVQEEILEALEYGPNDGTGSANLPRGGGGSGGFGGLMGLGGALGGGGLLWLLSKGLGKTPKMPKMPRLPGSPGPSSVLSPIATPAMGAARWAQGEFREMFGKNPGDVPPGSTLATANPAASFIGKDGFKMPWEDKDMKMPWEGEDVKMPWEGEEFSWPWENEQAKDSASHEEYKNDPRQEDPYGAGGKVFDWTHPNNTSEYTSVGGMDPRLAGGSTGAGGYQYGGSEEAEMNGSSGNRAKQRGGRAKAPNITVNVTNNINSKQVAKEAGRKAEESVKSELARIEDQLRKR